MDKHIIKRDGLPSLAFMGEEVGSGTNCDNNSTRWTTVQIYRTNAGRYIVAETYRTQWQGEHNSTAAASCATPQEVIEWLGSRRDGDGLGRVSQEAVEQAVKNDEGFKKAWVEEVE